MAVSPKTFLSSKLHQLILAVIALCFLAALIYLFWPKSTVSRSPTSSLESFTVCLKEKGVVMYGSDTCPNCLNQKKMFNGAFEKNNYVNCDFHQDECESHNISVYPVWIYGKSTLVGLQPLPKLSTFSGCDLPAL